MWYPLISTPGIRDAYLAISWPLVREAARWVLLLLLLFLFESNRLPVPWTISSVDATRIRRGPSHTRGVYTCAHVYRFKKTVPSSPFSSRNRYSEPFFGHRPTAFETAFIVLRFFLPFRFGSRLTDDRKLRMEFDFEVRCACMEWQRRPPRKWIKMLSLMAPSRRDGERLRFLIAR